MKQFNHTVEYVDRKFNFRFDNLTLPQFIQALKDLGCFGYAHMLERDAKAVGYLK